MVDALPIPFEIVKLRAKPVAAAKGVSLEEATLDLIHNRYGVQNVDFSGGIRTVPEGDVALDFTVDTRKTALKSARIERPRLQRPLQLS